MKKMTLAIAILSLILASPAAGLGQGQTKAKIKPPVPGVMTQSDGIPGLDQMLDIANPKTGAGNTAQAKQQKNAAKPFDKGYISPNAKNRKR